MSISVRPRHSTYTAPSFNIAQPRFGLNRSDSFVAYAPQFGLLLPATVEKFYPDPTPEQFEAFLDVAVEKNLMQPDAAEQLNSFFRETEDFAEIVDKFLPIWNSLNNKQKDRLINLMKLEGGFASDHETNAPLNRLSLLASLNQALQDHPRLVARRDDRLFVPDEEGFPMAHYQVTKSPSSGLSEPPPVLVGINGASPDSENSFTFFLNTAYKPQPV